MIEITFNNLRQRLWIILRDYVHNDSVRLPLGICEPVPDRAKSCNRFQVIEADKVLFTQDKISRTCAARVWHDEHLEAVLGETHLAFGHMDDDAAAVSGVGQVFFL